MKTFTITTTKTRPKLVIKRDTDAPSPRKDSNIGKFITNERGRNSPDRDIYLHNLMMETYEDATSSEDHLARLYKAISEVILIVPICRYEHSGVQYMTGVHEGYDYSNCGFYFVTKETYKEIFGDEEVDEEKILAVVKCEIEDYNRYLNGDIYSFELFNDEGDFVDSCSGFYLLEDMKEHLPVEWQDEDLEEYLKD